MKLDKELVKFIRTIYGLTQYEFGKKIGYSRTYVMMIERGFRDLSKQYENKIIETFDLKINDIVELKEWLKSVKMEVYS